MSSWTLVLAASAACFGLKLAGHLAPARLLTRPQVARTAALVTIALLAALVVVQTVASGARLALDARVAALGAAAVALALRAPFIVVVLVAAGVAAALRAAGWR